MEYLMIYENTIYVKTKRHGFLVHTFFGFSQINDKSNTKLVLINQMVDK